VNGKRVAAACLLLMALIPAVPAASKEHAGTFDRYEYTNDAGMRPYYVYVPSKLHKDAPVIVYLHGCTQKAPDAAVGTRFNDLAEQEGFIVVYPEQVPEANGSRCWNWFLPEHQQRGSGEASIIAGITEEVIVRYEADRSRVFVSGASAGAVMSTNMGVAYPDVYAAIGVVAGCAYLTCTDVTGEIAYGAMGDNARPVPVIAFQGTADLLVNYPLGRTVLDQWLGTNDLADDGTRNQSISLEPEVEDHSQGAQPQPGSGEPCVPPPSSFPCIGGALGFQGEYPHTIERYRDAEGNVLVEFWTIHGLGHAYAGGDPAGSFTDPLGPNVTQNTYDFFMAHPMPEVDPA
jgi:poly(hydroxyalkanoate) depolymerase family esterase